MSTQKKPRKKNPVTFVKNLKDLLAALRDPDYHYLAFSSVARVYERILELGVDKERSETLQRIYGEPELIAYRAFRGARGIERMLSKVVQEYIAPAANGAEQANKLLVLIGPPGTWKSRLGKAFMKMLEGCKPVPVTKGCLQKNNDNPLNILYELAGIASETAQGDTEQAIENLVQILMDLDVAPIIKESKSIDARNILLESDIFELSGPEEARAQKLAKKLQAVSAEELCQKLAVMAIEGLNGSDNLATLIISSLGIRRGSLNKTGPVCPLCRDRLMGRTINPGKPIKPAEFEIEWLKFDSAYQGTNGLVQIPEVDKNNFSISTYYGSKDLTMLGRLKPGDPRQVTYDGAFNRGQRGVVEWVEFIKNTIESFRAFLEYTQSQTFPVPAPVGGLIHADVFAFGHSNMKEWADFVSDGGNAPYLDRFCVFWFGYPTELSEVQKIERDMFNRSAYGYPVEEGGISVEPTIFMMAAALRVLSALKPDSKVEMLDKLLIYNGDDIRDQEKERERKLAGEKRNTGMGTKLTAVELRQRAPHDEGLSGLSPRFTADFLAAMAGRQKERGQQYITSRAWSINMVNWINERIPDPEQRKVLKGFLSKEVDKLRQRFVSKVLLSAFIPSFTAQCQDVFEKYLAAVERTLNTSQSYGYYSNNTADKKLMSDIEGDPVFGVSENEAADFRANLIRAISLYTQQHRDEDTVPYYLNRSIKECIERYVLRQVLPSINFLTVKGSRTEDQKKKLDDVIGRLVEIHGFHRKAAEELLEEAARTEGFITIE